MNIKTVNTNVADVSIDKNDIIIITLKGSVKLDIEDVIDINLIIRNLSDQRPVLKLLDARANWSIYPNARKKAIEQDALNKTLARAIVIPNVVKTTLMNFYKNFDKKDYPQKYFKDYVSAYNWLIGLKEN